MDEAPVIYGLEHQARTLATQHADTDFIRFFIGTQTLKAQNKIHLLEFDDEYSVVRNLNFSHDKGEIWHLATSLSEKSLLSTCYQNPLKEGTTKRKACIWRAPIPDECFSEIPDLIDSTQELEEVFEINSGEKENKNSSILSVLWHPLGSDKVLTVENETLRLFDLKTTQATTTCKSKKGQRNFDCGRWNPHHNASQVATANGTALIGFDLRTSKQTFHIENAHQKTIRDLDFNPNKQYTLVTGGDDRKINFWDLRNSTQPLKELTQHSHWVWNVRYNHFHDQLLLSSSSDSQVVLSNIISLSSDPLGSHVDSDDEFAKKREPEQDGIIREYEEHEDSVYVVEWSAADPWVFASLSYDGRLVVNHVPKEIKYNILL